MFIKIFFCLTSQINNLLIIGLAIFTASSVAAQETGSRPILLHAARVFDGNSIRTNVSILVVNGQIARIDTRESFKPGNAQAIDLGDATILPGFIELHAHLSFQNVPADIVLKHGITTIRDLGGPIHKPYGGKGSLRVLTSGPIITAPGGYPIANLGVANIATAVSTVEEAREAVRNHINGGAAVIKIALEPGGEAGAPWSSGHSHHKQADAEHSNFNHMPVHSAHSSRQAWPLLPENIVKAIVAEAHKHDRKVTAHLAEARGAEIAINSGVDEWAHIPCDIIPESLLKKAVAQNVKIVTTLDTLARCAGVSHNANVLASLGAEFLYGAEIAHSDIPWGIDAQELIYMVQMVRMQPIDVLRSATLKPGQHLNIPLLGTLQPGAPADIIAVKGNPIHAFKILEYPDLVISGGEIVVNNF
ncbi:Amidohydrolase [Candidatus Nitrotoga sp. HW29]|uniref:amidohydrolase family protein n=1 Tax=Candidatus Nitrotoga sp. HW29 TaxID=2886963 RepID=UPI001EF1C301|nr:amidohydrolase family protein [Candidatus Nitrotoga sp. HW29]CAH1904930.1 Amidohydrolase [Candidatus Nitrotoga sp. HW29]